MQISPAAQASFLQAPLVGRLLRLPGGLDGLAWCSFGFPENQPKKGGKATNQPINQRTRGPALVKETQPYEKKRISKTGTLKNTPTQSHAHTLLHTRTHKHANTQTRKHTHTPIETQLVSTLARTITLATTALVRAVTLTLVYMRAHTHTHAYTHTHTSLSIYITYHVKPKAPSILKKKKTGFLETKPSVTSVVVQFWQP